MEQEAKQKEKDSCQNGDNSTLNDFHMKNITVDFHEYLFNFTLLLS